MNYHSLIAVVTWLLKWGLRIVVDAMIVFPALAYHGQNFTKEVVQNSERVFRTVADDEAR